MRFSFFFLYFPFVFFPFSFAVASVRCASGGSASQPAGPVQGALWQGHLSEDAHLK